MQLDGVTSVTLSRGSLPVGASWRSGSLQAAARHLCTKWDDARLVGWCDCRVTASGLHQRIGIEPRTVASRMPELVTDRFAYRACVPAPWLASRLSACAEAASDQRRGHLSGGQRLRNLEVL